MLRKKREYKERLARKRGEKNKKTPEQLLEEKRKRDEILSSISSPNPWTPQIEDEWLKQSAKSLERRFPPIKKPYHVSKQGRTYGKFER
jgi:hypothetical protein